MTLPATGAISMGLVNTELGRSVTANLSLNDASLRSLFGVGAGAISMANGRGKSARTYATWNSAAKGSGIALSNNNLTMTSQSFAVGASRATISKASGKWYWEIYIDNMQSSGTSMSSGVGSVSAAVTDLVGQDAEGIGYWPSGWVVYAGGVIQGLSQYNTGACLGFYLDMDTSSMQITLDNVVVGSQGVAAGNVFPMSACQSNAVLTANFGASPFRYTPSAGYNVGLYL